MSNLTRDRLLRKSLVVLSKGDNATDEEKKSLFFEFSCFEGDLRETQEPIVIGKIGTFDVIKNNENKISLYSGKKMPSKWYNSIVLNEENKIIAIDEEEAYFLTIRGHRNGLLDWFNWKEEYERNNFLQLEDLDELSVLNKKNLEKSLKNVKENTNRIYKDDFFYYTKNEYGVVNEEKYYRTLEYIEEFDIYLADTFEGYAIVDYYGNVINNNYFYHLEYVKELKLFIVVGYDSDKFYIVNAKFEKVFEEGYEEIINIKDYFYVKNNNKWNLLDKNGDLLIPLWCDKVLYIEKFDKYLINLDNKVYLLDKQNNNTIKKIMEGAFIKIVFKNIDKEFICIKSTSNKTICINNNGEVIQEVDFGKKIKNCKPKKVSFYFEVKNKRKKRGLSAYRERFFGTSDKQPLTEFMEKLDLSNYQTLNGYDYDRLEDDILTVLNTNKNDGEEVEKYYSLKGENTIVYIKDNKLHIINCNDKKNKVINFDTKIKSTNLINNRFIEIITEDNKKVTINKFGSKIKNYDK